MFHKADWTQPQVGGLLSQLIVREEATLQRAPDRNHKVRANHRELSMHARQESFFKERHALVAGPTHMGLPGHRIEALLLEGAAKNVKLTHPTR